MVGLAREQRQVGPQKRSPMDGGRHEGAGRPDILKDEQILDIPHSTTDEDLHPAVSPDQGSQKVAVHTRLRTNPVHFEDDYRPDPSGSQRRKDLVRVPQRTRRRPPHYRPFPQVETTDDIAETHLLPDLGDLVGSCARLGCQDDPGHPDFEQVAGIRCRTDPRIDQELNPVTATGKCWEQPQIISCLFEGIQIRYVHLVTSESRVKLLQHDERIGAGRQAALHRPVSFAVAPLCVNRNPSSDVEHRNEPHSGVF